jgi:hypothetical protein
MPDAGAEHTIVSPGRPSLPVIGVTHGVEQLRRYRQDGAATGSDAAEDSQEVPVNWVGLVFLVVDVLGILFVIGRLLLRGRDNSPMKTWVRNQPVTFSTKALIRQRASVSNGFGWGTYKSPGGAQLLVRGQGIEVSLAPPFDRITSTGSFLSARETTMWIDRVGFGGSAIGATECIRLSGTDLNGQVDLAIRPTCTADIAWQALLNAGVTPTTHSE